MNQLRIISSELEALIRKVDAHFQSNSAHLSEPEISAIDARCKRLVKRANTLAENPKIPGGEGFRIITSRTMELAALISRFRYDIDSFETGLSVAVKLLPPDHELTSKIARLELIKKTKSLESRNSDTAHTDETVTLLRKQEQRVEDRAAHAKKLREAAAGAGGLAFFLLMVWAWVNEGNEEPSSDTPVFMWLIAISLILGALLWAVSYFKEP